ncbi:FkbM family methyltransferase [Phenylobacterium sp.]|uniref:FkbM family methyltransferase n=1 Tax=Phenylobacterium sp. TaxID=1871053 RepID=UPI002F3F1F6D
MAFLASREVDLVLDVGANVGQYAQALRARSYTGRIISFEPVRDVFRELEAAAASDPRWEVRNLALGAAPGKAQINVSTATEFSSFMPLTSAALRHNPDAAAGRSEEVDVQRLDDVLMSLGGKSVFLKVDVQGFEEQVLIGAENCLRTLAGVQLELPLEHMYRGDWDLQRALGYMADRDFVPSQVYPNNKLAYDPVSAVEVDCIFRRKTAARAPERADSPFAQPAPP